MYNNSISILTQYLNISKPQQLSLFYQSVSYPSIYKFPVDIKYWVLIYLLYITQS